MQTLADIARLLITQSWQLAILIVIVALASYALRNRSAHVRYLLWLIVLAKCLELLSNVVDGKRLRSVWRRGFGV